MSPIMRKSVLKYKFSNIQVPNILLAEGKFDSNKLTVIEEFLLCCSFCLYYEDFHKIAESDGFLLQMMESLQIECDKPVCNKTVTIVI